MKLYILIAALILVNYSIAQKAPTCCSITSANSKFVELGKDKAFIDAHIEPEPIQSSQHVGGMIEFRTPDGKLGKAFQILSPYNNTNYLIVFHEWWGLNDQMKEQAVQMYTELKQVNVIVVDLYSGRSTNDREKAAELMNGVKEERIRSIIEGLYNFIPKKADIITIGWCFGGGWSLQAAIMAQNRLKLCIMYYGMPETDIKKLKELQAPVIGFFASKDEWINSEIVNGFKENMEKAGKTLAVKVYDADHAFANPSNPQHDSEATEDAYRSVIKYITKYFQLDYNRR